MGQPAAAPQPPGPDSPPSPAAAAGSPASPAPGAADPAAASTPPDAELVRRAQDGDLSAYDELIRRHQARIYSLLYHMTANHEDANDLTQEAFIRGFHALPSFRGGSSFFTWIYRVAVNRALNFRKQLRNRTPHLSLNDLDFPGESESQLRELIGDQTPRRAAALAELQEKLNGALLKLSEKHRLVVTMHDIQGLSYDEIAQILGCNVATVRTRLFYARQLLQGLLADYLK
ncbi:RNA polymerase sigma factor [Verrucomicrobiota bacterium]|nr:RNA polymerase sigma factor [Verrucomicrobiota bacterium]